MRRWVIGCGVAAALAAAGAGGYLYIERRVEASAQQVLLRTFAPEGAKYSSLHYSLLDDRLEIESLAVEAPLAPLKPMHAARVSVLGIDPLGLRAVLAGTGAPQTLIYTGLVVESARGERAEAELLQISGIDFRRIPAAASDWRTIAVIDEKPASLMLTGLKFTAPDGDAAIERVVVAEIALPSPLRLDSHPSPDEIRVLLAGMTLRRAEIQGLDVRARSGERVQVKLRLASIRDVAPGRVGSIAIKGLDVESEKAAMSLRSVAVADIAYRPRSEAVRAKLSARNAPFPAWLPGDIRVGHFDLTGFRLGVADQVGITLAGIHASVTGTPAIATAGEARIERLAFDLSKLPPTPAFDPGRDGFEQLTLDVDARSTYDPERKVLEIPRYAIELEDRGVLTLSFALGEYVVDEGSDDPDVARERLMAATVRRAELSYEDRSLFNSLLRLSARRGNSEPEAVRAGVIDAIEKLKLKAPGDADWGAMLDAAEGFVKEPKSLTLTAVPPKPLTVQGLVLAAILGDAVALRKALGATAR